MGLFGKLKKLTDNLNTDKIKDVISCVNTESIEKKMSSAMNKVTGKVDDITADKAASAVSSMKDKIQDSYKKDKEDVFVADEIDEIEEIETADTQNEINSSDEIYEKEDYEVDQEDDYEIDEDEEDEETKARKKERNKKIAKGLAKGIMFAGSFMWAQKHGADSDTSILHAINKTKQVDSMFGGKKKNDDDEKEEKKSSDTKVIKAIGHYEYICPKTRRGHNIDVPDLDIPTRDINGTPSNAEAVEAIMKATGVSKGIAQSIWNGADSTKWHKRAYTYVQNGKRGMTVKCN